MLTPTDDEVGVSSVPENHPTEIKSKQTDKPYTFLSQRPGYLDSEGILHIKTRAAQHHFLLMLTFVKQVKTICRAARQDDPYADAYLIQIETQLETTTDFIREKIRFYEQSLSHSDGLLLPLVDTKNPLSLPLRFTTPYGYMAARALVEFDRLARTVISLYQFGLLTDIPLRPLLIQLGQPLYQLWKATQTWQPTGLTRAAVIESVASGDKTINPSLDPLVLNKTLRAKYAPPIIAVNLKSQPTEHGKSIE